MGRRQENTGFVCAHCFNVVKQLTNGSYRNHCPWCLWSVHVDRKPGDRAESCQGLMEPIELCRNKKGWQIVHRCCKCCKCCAKRVNKVAQVTEQPDDVNAIIELMNVQSARLLKA